MRETAAVAPPGMQSQHASTCKTPGLVYVDLGVSGGGRGPISKEPPLSDLDEFVTRTCAGSQPSAVKRQRQGANGSGKTVEKQGNAVERQ